MKKLHILAFIIFAQTPLFLCNQAIAYPQDPNPNKLKVDFNYAVTSNNATNKDANKITILNAGIEYKHQGSSFDSKYKFDVVKTANSAKSIDNVKRYLGSATLMFSVGNEKWYSHPSAYFFGKLQTEKDTASNYQFIVIPSVGYGRKLMHNDAQTLAIETGVGAQYFKDNQDDTDLQLVVTASAEYNKKLTELVTLEQDIDIEFGQDIRTLRTDTSIVTAFTDRISGQVNYQVKITDTDSIDTRDSMLSIGARYDH